jgi:hypothetical protein
MFYAQYVVFFVGFYRPLFFFYFCFRLVIVLSVLLRKKASDYDLGGFAPGFVNYKKGALDSWSVVLSGLLPPLKLVAMI